MLGETNSPAVTVGQKKDHKPTKIHVRDVCKKGQGENSCMHLHYCHTGQFYYCGKSLGVSTGHQTVAKSDNCAGWPLPVEPGPEPGTIKGFGSETSSGFKPEF